jgi:hypothetical protein
LWGRLIHLKGIHGGDNWCVVGDFNSVLSTSERRDLFGVSLRGPNNEIREFNDFVGDMGLLDLPLLGRRFTWFQPNGGAMSRLDRFLISEGWWDLWGEPSQWALARDVSDHCPIVLRYSSQLWGPKPFRFNNFWIDHRDFKDVVIQSWNKTSSHNWMAYSLKEKLKLLKGDLKIWNHQVFGNLDHNIELLVEEIKDLDLKAERGVLTQVEIDARSKGFIELWGLLKCRDSQIFQRSRSRWLKEGDANTGFFHASIKRRGRRNSILALRVGDRWVESVAEVRTTIVDYFKLQFSECSLHRPTLDGIEFLELSLDEVSALTQPFRLEEIQDVVASSDGNKSSGPDGFNFSFYKKFWDLIKGELMTMFSQFFVTSTLPRSFSSYFITLIPKVDVPLGIGDFRPISLVSSLYKLVAKVLAGRLSTVMDKLISPNQSAFIKGRQLVDGVVAVNEIIDFARKEKKSCLIFKVDFEKTYDSVSWSYLDYMLVRFGFGVKWRSWIRACVFRGNLSVLVNGSPTEEINIQRGLKQGDPLAPFLFLLVVEG